MKEHPEKCDRVPRPLWFLLPRPAKPELTDLSKLCGATRGLILHPLSIWIIMIKSAFKNDPAAHHLVRSGARSRTPGRGSDGSREMTTAEEFTVEAIGDSSMNGTIDALIDGDEEAVVVNEAAISAAVRAAQYSRLEDLREVTFQRRWKSRCSTRVTFVVDALFCFTLNGRGLHASIPAPRRRQHHTEHKRRRGLHPAAVGCHQ